MAASSAAAAAAPPTRDAGHAAPTPVRDREKAMDGQREWNGAEQGRRERHRDRMIQQSRGCEGR